MEGRKQLKHFEFLSASLNFSQWTSREKQQLIVMVKNEIENRGETTLGVHFGFSRLPGHRVTEQKNSSSKR